MKALETSEVYLIPNQLLGDIPVSRLKMLQTKRQRSLKAQILASKQ